MSRALVTLMGGGEWSAKMDFEVSEMVCRAWESHSPKNPKRKITCKNFDESVKVAVVGRLRKAYQTAFFCFFLTL